MTMEVKDYGGSQISPEAAPKRTGLQRSLNHIPSVKLKKDAPAEADSVSVEVEGSPIKPQEGQDLRSRLNEVINVVNVTSEAAASIHKLVGSIDGIVQQVDENQAPKSGVPLLEREANGLVTEIQRIAAQTTINGISPLSGDKVILEVRKELGKQLELIFPDDAKDGLGIGNINLSRKEAIIEARAKIKAAWKRIEALQASVKESSKTVKETAAQLEVAMQNAKAAESTPHDLETAMQLASETSLRIGANREAAMNSIHKLPNGAVKLLE